MRGWLGGDGGGAVGHSRPGFKRPGFREKRLRVVQLDGVLVWELVCPGCGVVGVIDDDQFLGRVSTDCPECPFHETVDWSQRTAEALTPPNEEGQ